MKKLNWSKASLGNPDPARVTDVGDYGIVSDEKAGCRGNLKKIRRNKPIALKKGKQLRMSNPVERAFPEARDGRAIANPNKNKFIDKTKPKSPSRSSILSDDDQWSNEDIQVLLLLWRGGISSARIGTLLNKSKNAIKSKAKRLQVKRRE